MHRNSLHNHHNYVAHSSEHHHTAHRIHALPPEIEMLRIKTYAAELTARINESLKILRNPQELLSTRRTHLQLAKERFSVIKKMLQEHRCITVSIEMLSAVESEIFAAETQLRQSQLPGTSANPIDLIERVRFLVKNNDFMEAEKVLLFCIETMEDAAGNVGTAPWYYEELCRIYRAQRQYAKEAKVLERYLRREKAPGTKRGHLYEQLKEVRRLVDSFGAKG